MPRFSLSQATPEDQPSTSGETGAAGVSQELATEANKGVKVKVELKNVIQSRRAALGLETLQDLSPGKQVSQVEKVGEQSLRPLARQLDIGQGDRRRNSDGSSEKGRKKGNTSTIRNKGR